MTIESGSTVIVRAQVLGHPIHNGKPTTQLQIGEWSTYPIVIYGTTPDEQAELPQDTTLRVLLQASRLKDQKDPERPYNWFWNYRGLAEDQGASGNGKAPDLGTIASPFASAADARQASIERQVAYKEAVAMTLALSKPETPEDMAGFWDMVFAATNVGESILNRTYTVISEETMPEAPMPEEDEDLEGEGKDVPKLF